MFGKMIASHGHCLGGALIEHMFSGIIREQLRDRHTPTSGSGHESAVRNTNGLTVDPGEERALYANPAISYLNQSHQQENSSYRSSDRVRQHHDG